MDILIKEQLDKIHSTALKILDQVGVRVENKRLLRMLADFGGSLDFQKQIIKFSPHRVEKFIADSAPTDMWDNPRREVGITAETYGRYYHIPGTRDIEPFNENTFLDYIYIAKSLPEIGTFGVLGLPFTPEGFIPAVQPLLDLLYAWKYGGHIGGSIQSIKLCPYLIEMYEMQADRTGKSISDIFAAVGNSISPLRMSKPECEQIMYFYDKGLRMDIYVSCVMMACSSPVTVAGSLAQNVAEQLFVSILRRCLWDDKNLKMGVAPAVFDLRSMSFMWGRPETSLMNILGAEVARYYDAAGSGVGSFADAALPGSDAMMQKAMTATTVLLSWNSVVIFAGTLGVDEVSSAVQMVLDVELYKYLKRVVKKEEVTEETLAFEDMVSVGPGGTFVGTELTAKHFRDILYAPKFSTTEKFTVWKNSGAKTCEERAVEYVLELLRQERPEPLIDEAYENELIEVIRKAEKVVGD